ncbi:General substrate transporter:Major facilitator superfamily (MFS) [Fulvimarina pelagi HTCC2506]|uniref:General substrate transporter:Major facilitator superfamily (MFS) n=1 Tax=Fulvimarina pelagi HTCC2506 TaxID=314231 RepID=Q0G5Z7_9HYPH|nr:MFS transporter [Fulvimarina pelagi]EAU42917.1 General substrate transporter:Major facilitator superfamily (MFS) [Fulvimarina pelagi HTCC2506]
MQFTRQIIPITALLVSTFFLMAGAGLQGILLPVRGAIEGWSSYEIGLLGTSYAIAFTGACVVMPIIVRSAGHVRTFSSLSALLAISVLLSAILVDSIAWIIFRAMAGLALAGCYMIVESWLNERVTNETRGAIFSIYMVVTMSAMMAGQYILPLTDPALATSFMVCAILFCLGVMPTALSRAPAPAPLSSVTIDIKLLFRNSPVGAVGVLLAGVMSGAWNNMAPVFGQQIGLSTTEIASLTVVAMAGGIVFQIPLGRISDKTDRRYVMLAVGGIGIFIAAAGAQLGASGASLLLAGAFVIGGVVYPSYSLAVAHSNDHADPNDFIKISSGLLILYGIGTMIGPLYTAYLMELFGPVGIFQAIGAAAALYAAYAFYRTFRRGARPVDERSDFQTIPLPRTQTPLTIALDPRFDTGSEDEDQTPKETVAAAIK